MDEVRRFGVFGAGGFGREVAWSMSQAHGASTHQAVCFVDDDAVSMGIVDGLPTCSLSEAVERYPDLPLAVAIAASPVRRMLVDEIDRRGGAFATLVHPTVRIAPTTSIGPGTIVCAGCLPTVGIRVGAHVHLNLACTVGHDVVIGDFVTLAPGVHVSGNVEIGDDVFIGTGATIINGQPGAPLRMGAGCVIGAGACVTGDTEPGTVYVGVPARPVRARPC